MTPPDSAPVNFVDPLRYLKNLVTEALLKAKAAEPLELEQMMTRYAVGGIITAYVVFSYSYEELHDRSGRIILIFIIGAWILGLSFLIHLMIWPAQRLPRRIASILGDAAMLSTLIGFGEESAAIFFPVYLWVTLGNGFRYGIGYLYGAIVANLAGFLIMAFVTPYWRDAWQFSVGLALAIVLIPLYVAKLIRSLHQAMNEAEAASRAKTEFLSMISHELRTPLTAILGLAHVSKVTAKSSKERFSAISTELAAGRLLRMVDTILKFQRIESGLIECGQEAFDPLNVLNEVQAIVEPLAQQKQLDFRILFSSGLPNKIISDLDHVQTIILNLATNAVKYTQHGSVSLEIGLKDARRTPELCVTVRDTGIGIAPEAQSRIFDRFVRAADHNVASESGVGLGLATCKSLTDLLGGKLGFESSHGQGSTFWAELPVRIPVNAEQAQTEDPYITPVFVGNEADFGGLIELTGGQAAAEAEAIRRIEQTPDDQACVLVVTSHSMTKDLRLALRGIRAKQKHAFALVSIGEDAGLFLENGTPFMGMSGPAASEADTAALMKTVCRWVWRISQTLDSDSAKVTVLTRCLTVLVADDNELNCQVLRRMLKLSGHKVMLANTGDEALQVLLDGQIDIALLDINMPGMSGADVCRAYRTGLGSGARIPVLALTADISEQTRNECLRAGMADVLGKPITLEQLNDAFDQYVLQGKAQTSGAAQKHKSAPPDGSAIDENRLAFLQDLFGDEGIRETFLPSFERDLLSSLERLQQALKKRSPSLVHDALHAIKSSAATAGARQILDETDAFRTHASLTDFEVFKTRIHTAYGRYSLLVTRKVADQPAISTSGFAATSA
jgi:two-component system sensor histidine kinase RpfC